MKTLQLIVIIIASVWQCESFAQDTFNFSYDDAGNISQRSLQLMMGGRIGHSTPDSTFITPLNFKVFPNPTNTSLNIEGDLPEDVNEAKLSLLNLNGQVLKKDVYTGATKTLDVQALKAGMYLLEVRYSEKKKVTYKIIVTN